MDSPSSPATPIEEAVPRAESAEAFSEQAARAGLVLPRPRTLNPYVTALIVVVVIVASIGIGRATGWLNPAGVPQNSNGCDGVPTHLWGGVSSNSTPVLGVLESMESVFANTTAGCGTVAVTFNESAENVGLAPLASHQVEFLVVPSVPSSVELAALPQPALVTPVALSGIGIAIHLPGVSGTLNLSGATLAGIYRGTITKWNDPLIAHLNPGIDVPANLTIHPFFRSDETGLNSAFTAFLAATNATWSSTIGSGPSVPWPAGSGVGSSGAMLANLSSTVGAIGYVEVGSSVPPDLRYASIENAAGLFLPPDANAISTAITSALSHGANLTSLTVGSWANFTAINAPGNGSYPIPLFSYLVVYGDLGRAYGSSMGGFSARILSILLWWMVSSGQSVAAAAGLTALPLAITQYSQHTLAELSYYGTALHPVGNPEGGEGGNETGEF
jgi:phosphate transport system substrate-binding protein